ncbi:hypothetical protein PV377_21150 [Streptomyces ipomoeae]|uniref:hypothetical protein n=1 Tax=Streptomyces ipomoeae TaxID=103232 RepID=UPI0029AE714F|nr:hypothetical protein [Streptomyces ipomoeae]MDX2841448.1 hypothetical protein [Streptomyces ipomoeae]
MNRVRLYLHRLFRRPAITDPMRIYTRRIPNGLMLDFEDYFTYVVEQIADDEDCLALFMEIVSDRATSREHDGWEPERLYVEQLAGMVGHEIPFRGKALEALANRLKAGVPTGSVSLPAQREAGAA